MLPTRWSTDPVSTPLALLYPPLPPQPSWYGKFNSPYYSESHVAFRAKVRAFVETEIMPHSAALTRSVAQDHKQGIKKTLKHLAWKGYKMDGLTPNMTRRAQAANWLLYYRRELRGVSIEELKRRRAERAAAEEQAGRTDAPTGTTKQGVV